jgi:putative SOS response-associated peptidase YedK
MANPFMQPVHDRMPVIIGDEETACWLGEDPCDAETLLKPFPESRMTMWAVGKAVGDVKNQGPQLAEAIQI